MPGDFEKDAEKSGFSSIGVGINTIAFIFEDNRKVGFPFCKYDKAGIYWDLKTFVEENKNNPDQKENVEYAESMLPHYEKHKHDPPVRRDSRPL